MTFAESSCQNENSPEVRAEEAGQYSISRSQQHALGLHYGKVFVRVTKEQEQNRCKEVNVDSFAHQVSRYVHNIYFMALTGVLKIYSSGRHHDSFLGAARMRIE